MKEAVSIEGLGYTYPDGTKALKDIKLDIYEGESLGVIGPNGAGKSTLLLHLNGILNSNGAIRIFDLKVNKDNLMQIRRNVGLVFQDPDDQLFMPTVFDDVAFGPLNLDFSKAKVKELVDLALREVGMQLFPERISHHLSFGEKKKISIATVLSMQPKILALDEPTSNLDPKSRRDLINLLRSLSLTKIIASHDLKMIQDLCQRTIILDNGRIVAIGKTKDILQDETLLKKHSLEIF
ncbi:ABC transporter ATP-binding protein [bacterium]|nr:ABC transporter ATP-binding protein [bacterium]